jgi:ATP-dependent RNA helicase DeaD
LREQLLAGELEAFRVVVETLADEFDPFDIAVAAVKLAHHATVGDSEPGEEIPVIVIEPSRPGRKGHAARDRAQSDRARKGASPKGERKAAGGPSRKNERRPRALPEDMVRIYIGAGRKAGVRPADLVGAIAGETGISGRAIGAINITDRFSLVEVPAEHAATIVEVLRGARIHGKKVAVRRDRNDG